MTTKPKIYPTCRLCEKMNTELTHCAIYGAITAENINNTAIGAACAMSGEYVRLLRAIPNEYNYGKLPNKQIVDEEADQELHIYDGGDESVDFIHNHGISLEEWAVEFFVKRSEDIRSKEDESCINNIE
ncbi:hypothetical protein JI735_34405 (plasmid) [Paenibacillus sonchi]|uniref:Uncharacterized protein n=1 Tax=Paenibacillus sonchi TaxID=373687 RepID=A0A974PIG9_9BACL|nr:hypothetical protein [Paenibacillus sonchi]QQZ64530.1 hypothetical protein JI735_34405 [Paenibacillus sonchi]